MTTPENNLNPQITDVDVGVRDLRTVKVYPLSLKDEKLFADIFQQTLKKYFEQTIDEGDEEQISKFVGEILKLIEENFIKILGLVTDENGQELFDSMTNMQASHVVMVIYRTNFEEPLKNAESLLNKVKTLFQLRRPLQPFLSDMPSGTFPISTEEPSETEDLPEDSS
jgi:hypothetical protein